MNAYGTGGTAGRVAALMAVAETESVRRAKYNPAWPSSARIEWLLSCVPAAHPRR